LRNESVTAGATLPPALPGVRSVRQLANGLTVCVLRNPQAPIVATALCFRAGTRDEPAGHGGVAHFLEHMMFKGAERYGPGAIDRRTQELGGANNAFTSHDLTVYYFNFARDRWTEALEMEADRLAGLTLDQREVDSERQVIEEEIAMYESEPWDALEMASTAQLFGLHPYGRPVLGTRAELAAIGRYELAAFQKRFYRPDNSVCVVAGDVGEEAFAEIEQRLGGWPGGAAPRQPPTSPSTLPRAIERLERRRGEVARLLLGLPGPPADHPDHAAVRMLTVLLGGGRSSRLHRALVDEGQLAVWISADLNDALDCGQLTFTAEVVPGVEPAALEASLFAELGRIAQAPPEPAELERARQVVRADWVFGHERIHEQAVAYGAAFALFGGEHLDSHLAALGRVDAGEVLGVAQRYLPPRVGGVLGWSLPREGR
jgi:zinc protease